MKHYRLVSILIIFNIFLNDLFLCLTQSELHNLADDNNITVTCDNLVDLTTLETGPKLVENWFRQNGMIISSAEFQPIVLESYKLRIDNNDITTITSMKLLDLNIDDELRFNKHTETAVCRRSLK